MDVKMVGPKDCEVLSMGDLEIEVENGVAEVPEKYIAQMRQHGFRLASEPAPKPPLPQALAKFQIVTRMAVASGLDKNASVDQILAQVEKLYAHFAKTQAQQPANKKAA